MSSRSADKLIAALPAKKERWLSLYEKRAETQFLRFRPYHVLRNGKPRLGAYDMRHCSQSVRDFEAIDRFFHAQKMRADGYLWSNNPRGWVYFGKDAQFLAPHDGISAAA